MTPTPISHISLSSWAISGRNIRKSKKAALGTIFINIWYLSVINCCKALICSSLLNYWVLVCDLIFKSFFSTCWLYSGRPCQKKTSRRMSGGGMWGSNPRHSEPQIRFRNLLNISRLTIQFNINFCLFWDIFGTLFYTKWDNFFP